MELVEELHRVDIGVLEDFPYLLEPVVDLAVFVAQTGVLVEPVGGDTAFGDGVHPFAADLHFDPVAAVAHHGQVQGFVAVALGLVHPVAVAVGLVGVQARDHREDGPALLPFAGAGFGREDDAYRVDVEDLFEGDVLGGHLLPDRVGGLQALEDGVLEAGLVELCPDGGDEIVDLGAALRVDPAQLLLDRRVGGGFTVLEPDVLHLRLDAVQAEAVGQRDEEEHGLAEDLVALVLGHELDGAHVVQAVGQLDQDDAHVVVEGHQDAPEVFCLEAHAVRQVLVLVVVVQGGLDLGESVDQRGDLPAEQPFDVLHREVGILHYVVEQGGADRLAAQSDLIDDDLGHGDRMQDVGFTAAAPDAFVCFVSELESLEDQLVLLFIGTAFPAGFAQSFKFAFDQFVILFCKHSHS